MKLIQENIENGISILKNPFKKDCVTDICIKYTTDAFDKHGYWYGYVEFKNQSTSGRQDFRGYKPDEFQKIVLDIEKFVNSLK